jgi:hypothetical protein
MRRSSTAGVLARTSVAWSALYLEVMYTRAPQSLMMYSSSPLCRRDEAHV